MNPNATIPARRAAFFVCAYTPLDQRFRQLCINKVSPNGPNRDVAPSNVPNRDDGLTGVFDKRYLDRNCVATVDLGAGEGKWYGAPEAPSVTFRLTGLLHRHGDLAIIAWLDQLSASLPWGGDNLLGSDWLDTGIHPKVLQTNQRAFSGSELCDLGYQKLRVRLQLGFSAEAMGNNLRGVESPTRPQAHAAGRRLWHVSLRPSAALPPSEIPPVRESETFGEVAKDGSSTFSVDDLKDASLLASKLKNAAGGVSAYIQGRLEASTRAELAAWQAPAKPPPALQEFLIMDLNSILGGGSIWDANRFEGVELRPETQYLINSNPIGEELVRLNRLLLEDAYRLELSKNPEDEVRRTTFGWIQYLEIPSLSDREVVLALLRNLGFTGEDTKGLEGSFDFCSMHRAVRLDRNRGVVITTPEHENDLDSGKILSNLSLQVGFLTLVRHFSNELSVGASKQIDAMHQGSVRKDLLEAVHLLQRRAVYLHDELHDLNIWNDSVKVELSRKVRDSERWKLAREVDETLHKLRDLDLLGQSFDRKQRRRVQRRINAWLAVIAWLGLFGTVMDRLRDISAQDYAYAVMSCTVLVGGGIVAFLLANHFDSKT